MSCVQITLSGRHSLANTKLSKEQFKIWFNSLELGDNGVMFYAYGKHWFSTTDQTAHDLVCELENRYVMM